MTDDTSKRAVREALLSARRALSREDREARSEVIARRILTLDAFQRAHTVGVYAALGAEVDTRAIALGAATSGKRVAFPRSSATARSLTFAECSLDSLVPGLHGTREPPGDASLVDPSAIDVVLVPGVAFDVHCRRLGRGRGHYDATLARLPATALRIGLAFELQLLDEVPHEPHDALLDAVVTESRVVFRLPPGAATGRSFA